MLIRRHLLSSGADLLDAVHKEIVVRPSSDGKSYEVEVYEGDLLPGCEGLGGVRVLHRHPDAPSAERHADDEFARSLAIGWLARIEASV